MQLKIKVKTLDEFHWYLIPAPDFTEQELKPLTENMKRAGIEILQPGESVRIMSQSFSKCQVLQVLQSR